MNNIIFTILIISCNSIFAADFMHDIGLGFWSKIRNTNNGQPTSIGPYVQYMPRCNFGFKEKMSISIASPIALGARFHPYEGNFFQMQLPATVLFNFGHAAFKKEKHYSNIGGYFGTGFNYILNTYESKPQSEFGIISLAGMRFYTHHHSLGFQFTHTHDFRFKDNFIGAGLFYTFGYFE